MHRPYSRRRGTRGQGARNRNYRNDFPNRNEDTDSFQCTKKLLSDIVKDDNRRDVALTLLDPSMRFKEFLDNNLCQDQDAIKLIIKAILKGSEDNLIDTDFRKVLQVLVHSNFLKKEIDIFISTKLNKCHNIELFSLLTSFMKMLFVTIPGQVYDILYPRVQNMCLLIENMKILNPMLGQEIVQEMDELKIMAESVYPFTKSQILKPPDVDISPPDDFRQISIYPTIADLLETETENVFLRKNKAVGKYKSVDDYLDVQFRLMHEDFIQPLREGLIHYLHSNGKRKLDVRIYENVSIIKVLPSERNGIIHNLQFDRRRFKNVKWDQSKRFLFGSLLCLSSDKFRTLLFATLVNRDNKDLEKGIISLKFEESNPDPKKIYTIIETTNLFESYKHVLTKLHETNESNLSMKQYIVFGEQEISLPGYLMRSKQLKYEINNLCICPGLDEPNWPSASDLTLDESQLRALKSALTKELTIIQGPPGTGKTCLGLKICESLMESVQKTVQNFGPILVVCYTNHALDQFLEGIMAFSDKIVRVGSRSKSEKLAKFQIGNLKKLFPLIYFKEDKTELFKERKTVNSKFLHLQNSIDLSQTYVIQLGVLENVISDKHFFYLQSIGLVNWLCGHQLTRVNFLIDNVDEDNDELTDTSSNTDDLDIEVNYLNNERELDIDYDDFDDAKILLRTTVNQIKTKYFERVKISTLLKRFPIEGTNFINKIDDIGNKYTESDVNRINRISDLKSFDRWRLYQFWVSRFVHMQYQCVPIIENQLEELNQKWSKITFEEDRLIMKNQDIIGMTTSGAARYGRVLADIKCKIIIVEEAAEVLESHVIASINPGCEHLILIGDHKQLKPNPTVFELARKYKLDLSMFERLINNKLHYNTLLMQHRMRPEIADIMKYFYKDLENHESVLNYPVVPGVGTNLFFFDHTESEELQEDSLSYSNSFEAGFIVKFCQYLLTNGIENSKITILTLYSGQMFLIRKLMPKKDFDGVRVCVVDNFQGEENDIILLSLVRSNQEEKIGFLKIENRICVSLSRAKHGLYVFGNFTILANQNKLWSNICSDLKRKNLLGPILKLFCQKHPEKQCLISKPEDFQKYPNRGCDKRCNWPLNCGHLCDKLCHLLDKNHELYKCLEICRKPCESGHPCELQCWKGCATCPQLIPKVIPKCGHEQLIACGEDPEHCICNVVCQRTLSCGHTLELLCGDSSTMCTVLVKRICNTCQHEAINKCYETPLCQEKCSKSCINGHPCNLKCYQPCEPCNMKIPKTIRGCNHDAIIACNTVPSQNNCVILCDYKLTCGHQKLVPCKTMLSKAEIRCDQICAKKCVNGHQCALLCNVPCGECPVLVSKVIPDCHHHQMTKCSKTPQRTDCSTNVEYKLDCGHIKMIPCRVLSVIKEDDKISPHTLKCVEMCTRTCQDGHRCKLQCNVPCGKCTVLVPKIISGCNHEQRIECFRYPKREFCNQKSDYTYPCGHQRTIPCGVKWILQNGNQNTPNATFLKFSKCEKPCTKSCKNGHPCRLKCGVPCGNCKLLMPKIIPGCNHQQMIQCYSQPRKIDCTALNEFVLSCGHRQMLPCNDRMIGSGGTLSHFSLCEEKCQRLCRNGHPCPLKCGDKCVCKVMVLKTIPGCNHQQEFMCHQVPETKYCNTACEIDIGCDHQKIILCKDKLKLRFRNSFYDVRISIYCEKKCQKTCERGHPCKLLCKQQCRKCDVLVLKTISVCMHQRLMPCHQNPEQQYCTEMCEIINTCGHKINVPCSTTLNDRQYSKYNPVKNCEEKCTKTCRNGHPCNLKCYQPCGSCKALVSKVVPVCNHEVMIECYKEPKSTDCKKKMEIPLPCGHKYFRICSEKIADNSEYHCNQSCEMILNCGHKCGGSCGTCNNGRLHLACGQTSQLENICGHKSQVKCGTVAPCNAKCNEGCFHKPCLKYCKEECIPCNKKCLWNCPHYKCSNPCKDLCERAVCNERCHKCISCSNCEKVFHCYGACGEMCMKLCITCDPQMCGLDHEYVRQSKFITLVTCGHSFEVDSMDSYMNSPYKDGMIALKRCPKCNAVINNRSCFRYSNIVKTILMDIRRVQNVSKDNNALCNANNIDKAPGDVAIYQEMLYKLELQNYIYEIENKKKKLSNLDKIKYKISLSLLRDVYKTFYTPLVENKTIGDFEYVRKSIIYLLNWLNPFKRTFNDFELNQFNGEFDRVNMILKISIHGANRKFGIDPDKLIRELKEITNFSGDIASEFQGKVLGCLGDSDVMDDGIGWDASGVHVTNNLDLLISGENWFKCPKGHYYTRQEGSYSIQCRLCTVDIGDILEP